jgi:predicted amidophosphoribosyltransferase
VWEDDLLISEINHLCAYHKWRLRDGSRNPNADKVTRYILDIKDGPEAGNFDSARSFFAQRLVAALLRLSKGQHPHFIAVVPSSTKDKESPGLSQIAEIVIAKLAEKGIEIQFLPDCLIRYSNVSKNASGGNRNIEKHLGSIKVGDKKLIKGKRILLIDDVAATGNSILACKSILKSAGASDVIMLVLGQTVLENE